MINKIPVNSKNIASLSAMLVSIGFDNSITKKILQHICFKPSEFELAERLSKGNDWLTCTILFERSNDSYTCNHYDVSFLKEIEIPDLTIQAIHIRELDQRMTAIDWDLSIGGRSDFNLNDETTWQKEQQIEKVVTDLSKLSLCSEGKYFADYLKLKHWSDIELLAASNNLNSIRSKFEVSQRFYFFDGKGISIEEAHRFLLNRWVEKKISARSKRNTEATEDSENNSSEGFDKALLQKKRKRKTKRIKQ